MSEAWTRVEDARRDAAADWLVRLQSADLIEAEALAFDAWLTADPGNAAAYDRVLSVTLELAAAAPRISRALRAPSGRRPTPMRRGWIIAGGLAAAATLAVAVIPLSALRPAPTQTYLTAKGEHRTVRLADGSVLDINAGSALSVTLARHERQVTLVQGEAVFDVAPDKARPFLIAVGDRTVRVVGTRFDVRRRDGQLSVTVERGLVEVRPTEGPSIAGPSVAGPSVAGPSVAGAAIGPRAYRLHPGQRLDHAEGAPDVQVSAADPAQVFAWRTGRLIYRDQPLGDVIADLNQQFPRPIMLEDPALASTRVSGVLVLDDQAAVIRRLALLAPIKALPSERGVLLRSDLAAKP